MKRTLAITATTAMLALSLAGCGAERNGDMDLLPDFDGNGAGTGTTATDTMRNGNAMNGTGTTGGASTNSGLNGVTGAVNRGTTQYGSARYGTTSGSYTGGSSAYRAGTDARSATFSGGMTGNGYTATNNGGLTAQSSTTYNSNGIVSPKTVDRYALMLENARVHDSDGFLLDGENSSWRTF